MPRICICGSGYSFCDINMYMVGKIEKRNVKQLQLQNAMKMKCYLQTQ